MRSLRLAEAEQETFLRLSIMLTGHDVAADSAQAVRADLLSGPPDLETLAAQQMVSKEDGSSAAAARARSKRVEEEMRSMPARLQALLDAFAALEGSGDLDKLVQEQILADPNVGPMARTLIVFWYTGGIMIPGPGATAAQPDLYFPTKEAYVRGLVWPTAQAHPMGVTGGYFGYWHYEPEGAP